ncbi:hypothetical protein FG386_000797 [Cryptosporidium ryanae]|uniref:uncharacterized protein n=1 Tax=Cryptosporidium ryanae TaxID=515981 RepID=UPI00351A58EB|nr:hypothetical protein FG386_000797 [Cryptosporidium ryanae]
MHKRKATDNSVCANSMIIHEQIMKDNNCNRDRTKKLTIFSCIVFTVFLFLRHRMILQKTYKEQKMSLFSETAFYYSFYEEIVNSSGNIFITIMDKMIFDRRTEYPDTINSISRFNIYQEIFLGIAYRLIKNLSFGAKYLVSVLNSIIFEKYSLKKLFLINIDYEFGYQNSFISPFNFYYYSINTILGVGMGFLCGTSTYISDGSYKSGLVCIGFLFGNFQSRLLSRISSLPLRENFALPVIWINNFIFISILKQETEETNKKWFLFFLTSLIQLEFWQFSVFVISIQMISVFTIYLLGYEYNTFELKLMKMIKIHLFSLACSYLFHFFNNYILFSSAMSVGISIFLSITTTRLFLKLNKNGKFSIINSLCIGLFSLLIFIFINKIISPFSNDDTHVYDMLKSLLLGKEFSNFDTMIYKMGGSEFSWINKQQLKMVYNSGVLYFFLPNVLIISLMVVIELLKCIFNSNNCNSRKESLELDDFMLIDETKNFYDNISLQSFSSDSSIRSSSTSSSPKSITMSASDWKSCNEYLIEQDYSAIKRNVKKNTLDRSLTVNDIDIALEVQEVKPKTYVIYLFIQTIFFCILAITISRLRVLAIPYISVFSSLLASRSYLCFIRDYYKNIYSRIFNTKSADCSNYQIAKTKRGNFSVKLIFKLFSLLFSLFMLLFSFLKFPLSEIKSGLVSENNSSSSKSRLVDWINLNLPDGTPILADMVVSSTLRLMTNAKIVTHPQYENIKIRKRTQFIYSISACIPIRELYESMDEIYKTEYLLLSIYRCATPINKDGTITVIDVTEYLDNIRHRCNNQENIFQRTCWRIQLDNSSRYFELIYRNAQYSIYRRIKRTEIGVDLVNSYSEYDMLNNYSQFSYTRKLLDWSETWKPWIVDNCIENDPFCPQNIVDYARMIIDIYNLIEVSKLIYERAISLYPKNSYVIYNYAEFLDYDLGGDSELIKKYYIKSIELITIDKTTTESIKTAILDTSLGTVDMNPGFILKMIIGFILYNEQINGRSENSLVYSIELIVENETIKNIALNLDRIVKNDIIKYLNDKIVDINYDMCLSNLAYNICMISSYLKSIEMENRQVLIRQKKYPIWLINTIYSRLWRISNEIDPNNACIVKYWSLFNRNTNKRNLDYLHDFFLK